MRSQWRRWGVLIQLGLLLFVAVAVAVQSERPALDWRQAPLSFYLIGPHGHWLQAVYFLLAAALALLGGSYWRALAGQLRSVAPWLLFVCAGVGLCVTALAHSNLPDRPPTLEGFVHGVAAQSAFLCVTVAMLLQSWWLRHDPPSRQRFPEAFGLALICFAAIWVDALWHGMPRGLEQRLVIALILLWLWRAAASLRRRGESFVQRP